MSRKRLRDFENEEDDEPNEIIKIIKLICRCIGGVYYIGFNSTLKTENGTISKHQFLANRSEIIKEIDSKGYSLLYSDIGIYISKYETETLYNSLNHDLQRRC